VKVKRGSPSKFHDDPDILDSSTNHARWFSGNHSRNDTGIKST
jgi:hypothetical protein